MIKTFIINQIVLFWLMTYQGDKLVHNIIESLYYIYYIFIGYWLNEIKMIWNDIQKNKLMRLVDIVIISICYMIASIFHLIYFILLLICNNIMLPIGLSLLVVIFISKFS